MIESLKKKAELIKRDVFAVYLAYTRHSLPWYAKTLAILVLAYALSPIDLIPDFIPVLGLLDDIILIPLGLSLLVKIIPLSVMEECRREAEDIQNKKLPKNHFMASLIILFWSVVIFWIIYKILK